VPNPTVLLCGRDWGALMAGALLGSLPVAVIYSFFVEYYVSGLTGAVKEQGR
jgi:multiple sugar transport system permease protein